MAEAASRRRVLAIPGSQARVTSVAAEVLTTASSEVVSAIAVEALVLGAARRACQPRPTTPRPS
jgi:hypothetical protein